jgi:hypothetical protein
MTRNYALTFAGVTLRLWLPIFGGFGIEFLTGYLIVSWLCWIPNLFVAQWIIIKRRRESQPRARIADLRANTMVSRPETAQTDF